MRATDPSPMKMDHDQSFGSQAFVLLDEAGSGSSRSVLAVLDEVSSRATTLMVLSSHGSFSSHAREPDKLRSKLLLAAKRGRVGDCIGVGLGPSLPMSPSWLLSKESLVFVSDADTMQWVRSVEQDPASRSSCPRNPTEGSFGF